VASGEIVFFGTPALCLPFLEELSRFYSISLIITQPDRPAGRQLKLTAPAVKKYAETHSIPCIQPDKLSGNRHLLREISALNPLIGITLSYGRLVPREIFSLPRFGTVNLHFSLLPELRGAAPVQRALEKGLAFTGLTVFALEEKLDSGPIWKQHKVAIDPAETTEDFMNRILPEAAVFLRSTIGEIIGGLLTNREQDHLVASQAPRLLKEEGRIDWSLPAPALYNKWRAFTPWPGLYFTSAGRQVRLLQVRSRTDRSGRPPGTVLSLDQEKLTVSCAAGTAMEIISLQPAGKKAMSAHAFSLGNPLPRILP